MASPNNGDFTNQGYSYAVHYDGTQPGPLHIAIYDPAENQQDNICDTGGAPASGLPNTTDSAALVAFGATDPNAAQRYADATQSTANNTFCAGDTAEMPNTCGVTGQSNACYAAPDMYTSYVVRAPVAGQPVSDLTNQPSAASRSRPTGAPAPPTQRASPP